MENESHKPISKNEFYLVQKSVAENIKAVKEHISEKYDDMKEQLNRIEIQTTETNGKVRSLQVWRGFITGGLAIVTVLLIPILFMLIQSYVSCYKSCTGQTIQK